jgi:hypothetical protein
MQRADVHASPSLPLFPLTPEIPKIRSCRRLAGQALLFQLALGVAVVLGGVDAVVGMVDEVEPGHDVDEDAGVS